MRSSTRGKRASAPVVEVPNVSPHRIWLWVAGREHLLAAEEHPRFREATIAEMANVDSSMAGTCAGRRATSTSSGPPWLTRSGIPSSTVAPGRGLARP